MSMKRDQEPTEPPIDWRARALAAEAAHGANAAIVNALTAERDQLKAEVEQLERHWAEMRDLASELATKGSTKVERLEAQVDQLKRDLAEAVHCADCSDMYCKEAAHARIAALRERAK